MLLIFRESCGYDVKTWTDDDRLSKENTLKLPVKMRKHVAWYTFGFPGAAKLREKVNHTETYEDLEELLQTYLKANH